MHIHIPDDYWQHWRARVGNVSTEAAVVYLQEWLGTGIRLLVEAPESRPSIDGRKTALAPFSGMMSTRDDIEPLLVALYQTCQRQGDASISQALRTAICHMANPFQPHTPEEVVLLAQGISARLGFHELANDISRFAGRFFSLSSAVKKSIRDYAKQISGNHGRDLINRLIIEAKGNSARDNWRHWLLVAALDMNSAVNIVEQRTLALDVAYEALSPPGSEIIADPLAKHQITATLLGRLAVRSSTPFTPEQAEKWFIIESSLDDMTMYEVTSASGSADFFANINEARMVNAPALLDEVRAATQYGEAQLEDVEISTIDDLANFAAIDDLANFVAHDSDTVQGA